MANESYIERLQRERGELIEAIVAVLEFHAARTKFETSPYKYDERKVVDAKRETMHSKIERVSPLLKGGK